MTHERHDDVAPATAQVLREFGYSISWREAGWHECLISGHGESWHGHGLSPAEALENALRQALPSNAARRCFEESLQRALDRQAQPATEAPEPPLPAPAAAGGPEPPVNGRPAPAAAALDGAGS